MSMRLIYEDPFEYFLYIFFGDKKPVAIEIFKGSEVDEVYIFDEKELEKFYEKQRKGMPEVLANFTEHYDEKLVINSYIFEGEKGRTYYMVVWMEDLNPSRIRIGLPAKFIYRLIPYYKKVREAP